VTTSSGSLMRASPTTGAALRLILAGSGRPGRGGFQPHFGVGAAKVQPAKAMTGKIIQGERMAGGVICHWRVLVARTSRHFRNLPLCKFKSDVR
jgi:hypothetical protein